MAKTRKPAAQGDELPEVQFQAISRALADPRRFAILQQIAAVEEPTPCSALDVHADISPATVSHHLKDLVEAGLVAVERDGRCANLSLQRKAWKAYVKRLRKL